MQKHLHFKIFENSLYIIASELTFMTLCVNIKMILYASFTDIRLKMKWMSDHIVTMVTRGKSE